MRKLKSGLFYAHPFTFYGFLFKIAILYGETNEPWNFLSICSVLKIKQIVIENWKNSFIWIGLFFVFFWFIVIISCNDCGIFYHKNIEIHGSLSNS